MKRYLRLFVALSLLGPLFVACQQQKEEVKPAATPGAFVVSATSEGASSGGRTAQGASGTEFELGDLKASRAFLFMLANGGDEAIFDVTITSDKPAFEVTPQRIRSLPGKGSTGIVPLIQVGIIHGKLLNGNGLAPVLQPGVNEATIKLKGKTIANNDTVEVLGEFTVSVVAKVAGLKVFRNGVQVTYSGAVTLPELRHFAAPPGGKYTLVNTGNVTLRPEVFHYVEVPGVRDPEKVGETFELLPGQTKDITSLVDPRGWGTLIEFFDTGAALVTPISTRNVDTLEAIIFMQKPL
jgi:hypothetical protein